jgi:hypothetical protein
MEPVDPACAFFRYRVFGWSVWSELECPQLEQSSERPDICFRLGSVPAALPGARFESLVGRVLPGQFLLTIEGTARFLIREGTEVLVEPFEGALNDSVCLFLLGPVLGILLHQRSILPLHGSGILHHGGAVVFAGPTGSGKSTLAAAFHRRGYRVLADEICAVETSATPKVLPSPPYLALWQDALAGLGVDLTDLRPVRPDLRKFLLPIAKDPVLGPVPLHHCYVLEYSDPPFGITLQPLEGMRKIETLALQTYRRTLIDALDLTAGNFEQACKVSVSTKVTVARRPRGTSSDELADAIERDFAT